MRAGYRLNRYVFLELWPPFFVAALFFIVVFLLAELLEIADLIVNYGIGLAVAGRFLLYTFPFFLELTIPIWVMIAVLLTFLRISADNEIVALKATGIGLYQMLPGVLLFCVFGFLLTGLMAVYGMPWGGMGLKRLMADVITKNADIGITERVFIDRFDDITLYVHDYDPRNRTLTDVFIDDRRGESPAVITAPRGRLLPPEEEADEGAANTLRIRLRDGFINRVNLNGKSAYTVRFGTYEVALNLGGAAASAAGGSKDETEMTLAELREYLSGAQEKDAQYYITLMEYYKKVSIPFSCFALGILALPLGVRNRVGIRSAGLGPGIVAFVLYYLLTSAGMVFGESGSYPPLIGMWMPNVAALAAGVFLLVRTVNERPVAVGALFGRSLRLPRKRFETPHRPHRKETP